MSQYNFPNYLVRDICNYNEIVSTRKLSHEIKYTYNHGNKRIIINLH